MSTVGDILAGAEAGEPQSLEARIKALDEKVTALKQERDFLQKRREESAQDALVTLFWAQPKYQLSINAGGSSYSQDYGWHLTCGVGKDDWVHEGIPSELRTTYTLRDGVKLRVNVSWTWSVEFTLTADSAPKLLALIAEHKLTVDTSAEQRKYEEHLKAIQTAMSAFILFQHL